MIKEAPCPCSPHRLYRDCCQPYHKGTQQATNAEQLMRSRYSAYALNLNDYIIKTWAPITRPKLSPDEISNIHWIKLIINRAWIGKDNEAFVDFDAFYEQNGQTHRMHEVSRFLKNNKQWFYVDGKVS